MPLITTVEQGAHWYKADGQPDYWREMVTKPGEYRKTTLRDARKDFLRGSVTTVLDLICKPNLQRWKMEQYAIATHTTPRFPDESDEHFFHRVNEAAQELMAAAADLGSRVHQSIEDWIRTETGTTDTEVAPMLEAYQGWHDKNIVEVIDLEHSFATDAYGGCIDMIATDATGKLVIWDFKTQKVKTGKPFRSYPEHGWQLAAYKHGISQWDAATRNILISTNPEDRRVEEIDHTADDAEDFATFMAIFEAWCKIKKYDPRQKGTEQ